MWSAKPAESTASAFMRIGTGSGSGSGDAVIAGSVDSMGSMTGGKDAERKCKIGARIVLPFICNIASELAPRNVVRACDEHHRRHMIRRPGHERPSPMRVQEEAQGTKIMLNKESCSQKL